MTHYKLIAAAALVLVLGSSGVRAEAPAQDEQSILLDTLRSNRKAFVAVNLDLSPDEAKGFWPVYDKYQTELNGIQERALALVQEYTTHFSDLSDDRAKQLIQDYLTAEADRVKVRQSYLPEFSKVVSGRTVARFYQLENKMDAVVRYELAGKIPVIEQKAAPSTAK